MKQENSIVFAHVTHVPVAPLGLPCNTITPQRPLPAKVGGGRFQAVRTRQPCMPHPFISGSIWSSSIYMPVPVPKSGVFMIYPNLPCGQMNAYLRAAAGTHPRPVTIKLYRHIFECL
ncbi:hypothetical protein GJ744_002882 [Endocarpon pusillum]|uniref:Uncharacterized protein n=1 Tax=Endocarpon pusillum TaxID=364733 RepID=A0A8H7A8F9_9EURO|nr:hypothetical protein GJ744_002882 [Endocarpon pusillum]